MLVLSRKVGERIQIGNEIAVTVLGVEGHRVRLGVEAPRATPVWRAEVPWLETAPPDRTRGVVRSGAAHG
jgi:carbon storage regulator